MNHTPGPWRVVARKNARGQDLTPAVVGRRSWGGNREWPVAVASAISQDETDANARLIAAAPQMLAALKLAYSILTDKAAREEIGALLNAIEGPSSSATNGSSF